MFGLLVGASIFLPGAVENYDNYRVAHAAAQAAGKYLIVDFVSPDDLDRSETDLGRVLESDTFDVVRDAFVVARLSTDTSIEIDDQQVRLLDHPSMQDLHKQPGLAILDLTNSDSPHFGRVVSVYPLPRGAMIGQRELLAIMSLPPGSLTQRTMILAVRLHADAPASTSGEFLPVLADACQSHARHQAAIRVQGHHNWSNRFHRINEQLPSNLVAQEVCAESWPGEALWDAARGCVGSWRHSPGHWDAVSTEHPVFAFDIKRGSNGIWYAVGIFGRRR